MPDWLEGLTAPDLGIVIAGNHYAATQTMDEEHRQQVTFQGAFGSERAVIRNVRKDDEGTVSFSALLLQPGQEAGMDDERFLLDLGAFSIACRRGSTNAKTDWHTYQGCAWNTVRVASTLTNVTLNADFSVPGFQAGAPAK